MICGALQTLNEEACEDVLDETEAEIPQTSLIPPSPTDATGETAEIETTIPESKLHSKNITFKDEAGTSQSNQYNHVNKES